MGMGPTLGRTVTADIGVMRVHSSSFASDQTGSSWRHTIVGSPELTSRTASSTDSLRSGGWLRPWNTFQLRMTTLKTGLV